MHLRAEMRGFFFMIRLYIHTLAVLCLAVRDRLRLALRVDLLLRRVPRTLVSQTHVATHPHCPQQTIPEREEGLAEVRLDAPALVVDVVVAGIVAGQMLKRIEWERVATVVVDGLDGAECEEPHALPDGHARRKVGESRTKGVEEEAFKGMIVQGAVGVRDVEAVVTGVEGCCQGFVSALLLYRNVEEMEERGGSYCIAIYSCACLDAKSIAMYRQ